MKRLKKITAVITAFVLSVVLFTACETKEEKTISTTEMFFDTVISIKLFDTDDENILDECKDLMETYEEMFSRTIPTSEVSLINNSGGTPVKVSDETLYLIETAVDLSIVTDGAFDITTAVLSDLWNIKENPGIIPDEEDIEEALSHVGYENIVYDKEGNVSLTDPDARIDLGALAKGYVGDKLKEYLVEQGVKSGIIDLGGNIVLIGSKPDGSNFNIGLQKPFSKRNEIITSVKTSDKSVVSSGNYERYFEKDGKIYHHIFDPFTGYPVDNELLQASIICDSSLMGDALSTSCFILGAEKGRKLIDTYGNGAEVILITKDMEIIQN